MSKKEEIGNDYVKKTTLMLTALIALVVGFLAGVIYSAYKLDSFDHTPGHAPPREASREQGERPDYSDQIHTLEMETSKNPGNVDAWIHLGNLYFDSENIDGAIGAYEKALEITPDNPDVLTDLGVMYRRHGEPEKAVETFSKAISIEPAHAVSRFNKGVVLMHDLNDPNGAIEAWEELLRINPTAKAPTGKPLGEMVAEIKAMMKKQEKEK